MNFVLIKPGSPPPTRGTLCCRVSYWFWQGITPAYAGNTPCTTFNAFGFRDHPRLRGEHVLCMSLIVMSMGSPPPTRGTPSKRDERSKSYRITPAYAGNTTLRYKSQRSDWDHPRLRGEHSVDERLYGSKSGITPAYAGNTARRSVL